MTYKMKLLEFPHSHYCEKARWALDYKGIAFEPVAIIPGFHFITVRKYAPSSSVPVLIGQSEVVQGSEDIVSHLEQEHPDKSLTPTDASDLQKCLNLERDMDERLGENIRRVLYDGLLAYPEFVRYAFTHPLPKYKQVIFSLCYPLIRYKIYKTYVISDARVKQAKEDFAIAMAEIETIISKRPYLLGSKFTRADMAIASMLSLLVMPDEHPFPWRELPDEETKRYIESYLDHPVVDWVKRVYKDHRTAPVTLN